MVVYDEVGGMGRDLNIQDFIGFVKDLGIWDFVFKLMEVFEEILLGMYLKRFFSWLQWRIDWVREREVGRLFSSCLGKRGWYFGLDRGSGVGENWIEVKDLQRLDKFL